MDKPLCSRRAWTTCQGPVDPSRLTTYPHPGCYDDGVVLPRFQIRHPDRKTVGVTIITTIHIQRPTLLYLYQFYPGKTRTSVPLLSRHSQRLCATVSPPYSAWSTESR